MQITRRNAIALLAGVGATVTEHPCGLYAPSAVRAASHQSSTTSLPAASTVLAIDGTAFTINDTPTFLAGFSYYGGTGASAAIVAQDLDALKAAGFRWLRVWATWESFGENVSAVDADGEARQPYMQRLQALVAACDARAMIVDVTLARSSSVTRSGAHVHLQGLPAHRRAVHTITAALQSHRNWYLDLANERDVRDDRYVSIPELKELRDEVRQLAPSLIVTASFGGHDLTRTDVAGAVQEAGLDLLAVHRPRHAGSAARTAEKTRELLDLQQQLSIAVPVHHQEPFRRGYANWEPQTADFVTDLRGAMSGGAAGWCFHNGASRTSEDGEPRRSFDLRHKSLIEQLDDQEREFIQQVPRILADRQPAE
ncbi:MAG: hypothetical protein KDA85_14470 [Planctomycetaceae bacterium]|nr:hypothetical protein [Planctomycetaceae bacterium]